MALTAAVLAVLPTVQFAGWLESAPFSALFAAVIFSAWFGGFGPGMFVTGLAVGLALTASIEPFSTLAQNGPRFAFVVGVFAVVATSVSAVVEVLHRANRRVAREAEERKRTEDELRRSEHAIEAALHGEQSARAAVEAAARRLTALIENSSDAVALISADGVVNFASESAFLVSGYRPDELIGRNTFDAMHPDDVGRVRRAFTQALDNPGVPASLEYRSRHKNGEWRDLEVTAVSRANDPALGGVVLNYRDVTQRRRETLEREQLAAQVKVERARLAAIIASVPGVVWEAWGEPDIASQRIDFVSEFVEPMLGYRVDDWLGQPNFWLTIVHPADRDRAAREAAAIYASGKSGSSEFRWLTRDGRTIWVEAHSMVVCNANGKPIGMRGVTMDITERRELRDAQAVLYAEAKEANRLKDEFLATLSHELRTPLNAVLGWAALLRTGRLGPDQTAHAVEIIERNAQLQTQLVEDLLDVSRIIRGKMQLEVGPVDLSAVLEAALDSVRPAADAKGVRLTSSLHSLPTPPRGDRERLYQVASNLLSNSVKFTPAGGQIDLSLRDGEGEAVIVVRDTGAGIRREFLPYLFDRFRQGDSTTTRAHGGLGIGLAIVRHLVSLHGGTVTAESDGEGQGATFIVRLPLTIEAPSPRDLAIGGTEATLPSSTG